MTILSEAYDLISSVDNPIGFNPDYVYKHFFPDNMPDDTPKEKADLLILVTDIQSIPIQYASNISHGDEGRVQIQVWCPLTDSTDYKQQLKTYLEAYGFYMYDSFIAKDPDVERLFLTAKFNKHRLTV